MSACLLTNTLSHLVSVMDTYLLPESVKRKLKAQTEAENKKKKKKKKQEEEVLVHLTHQQSATVSLVKQCKDSIAQQLTNLMPLSRQWKWGDSALSGINTKDFFSSDDALSNVAKQFARALEPRVNCIQLSILDFPLLQQSIELTPLELATYALQAIKTYHDFCYTPQPDETDFENLSNARVFFLMLHKKFKWRILPTTHYATSHFLQLSALDGTAFIFLSEGLESSHKRDKALALHVRPFMQSLLRRSSQEQMLNQIYIIWNGPSRTGTSLTNCERRQRKTDAPFHSFF